jgi:hypothetical protein
MALEYVISEVQVNRQRMDRKRTHRLLVCDDDSLLDAEINSTKKNKDAQSDVSTEYDPERDIPK